jgi:hypothetical protein
MDQIVEAALRKWPNVPHCYGWLGLDARGEWYLRDAVVQGAGPFPSAKGSRIEHAKLRAFIERNYAADAEGCWFFQNGPQRVYVELEAAPWVWRLQVSAEGVGVRSHTGQQARAESACVDEDGRLFLVTDLGAGLVHSLDMELAVDEVETGRWRPETVRFPELPARFGYRLSPAALRGSTSRQ